MNNEPLTKIEHALVIQYLIDGNVPVTVSSINSQDNDDVVHSIGSAVFPIALRAENIKVEKDGIIYLINPPQSISGFENKDVKVEFYFNKVGLFFTTFLNKSDKGLYFSIPQDIYRINDVEETVDYDFHALLYFDCNGKRDLKTKCIPWNKNELFARPVWKNIPLESQKKAKEYLEIFVERAKLEKNAGNGIQLISVCHYLTQEDIQVKSIQDRRNPLAVLYIDHERIVLGSDNKDYKFEKGNEYALKFSFNIAQGPITSRDIFVVCVVNNIYKNDDESKTCIDFVYSSVQEEDIRYLYEKTTKNLFI